MKEYFELIKEYESITLEEISELWQIKKRNCAHDLTGFGDGSSCKLCQAYYLPVRIADKNFYKCDLCPWMKLSGYKCNSDFNLPTYEAIALAWTPEELFKSYKDRAEYMKEVLKLNNIEYEKDNN